MLFPYKLKNVQSKEYTAQTCPTFVQLLTPLLGDPPCPPKKPSRLIPPCSILPHKDSFGGGPTEPPPLLVSYY